MPSETVSPVFTAGQTVIFPGLGDPFPPMVGKVVAARRVYAGGPVLTGRYAVKLHGESCLTFGVAGTHFLPSDLPCPCDGCEETGDVAPFYVRYHPDPAHPLFHADGWANLCPDCVSLVDSGHGERIAEVSRTVLPDVPPSLPTSEG